MHAAGGAAMKYNVSQLLKEPIGSNRSFPITEGEFTEPGHPGDTATGDINLVRTHHGIWAYGAVSLTITQDCSRCLLLFMHALNLEIDEEFFPEVDVKTGRRISAPDDWEGFYIAADHILDLSEPTRQAGPGHSPAQTPVHPGLLRHLPSLRNQPKLQPM